MTQSVKGLSVRRIWPGTMGHFLVCVAIVVQSEKSHRNLLASVLLKNDGVDDGEEDVVVSTERLHWQDCDGACNKSGRMVVRRA